MSETVHTFTPPLDEYRERARRAAMAHFVAVAMQDRRPDTQRAMDAVKAAEARLMLMPGSDYVSALLTREAEIRSRYTGQTVAAEALARSVDAAATRLEAIELARVEVSVGIDAAVDVPSIAAILTRFGVAIPQDVGSGPAAIHNYS